MIFKVLIRYIMGFVNITVEGYFLQRFINICASKKIFLWNVKRDKASIMKANIGINDFKSVRELARTTKCKVSLNSKRGLPFLLNRYKKRKILLIFIIAFTILINITTQFIWNIEVIGNETISTEELLQNLKENGIDIGKLKNKVNTKGIIDNLRLQRDDLAWIRNQD